MTERFQKIDAAIVESNAKRRIYTFGRYDIFIVLLSEGDTTITLLCERVNSTAQFYKLLKEIYCYMIT